MKMSLRIKSEGSASFTEKTSWQHSPFSKTRHRVSAVAEVIQGKNEAQKTVWCTISLSVWTLARRNNLTRRRRFPLEKPISAIPFANEKTPECYHEPGEVREHGAKAQDEHVVGDGRKGQPIVQFVSPVSRDSSSSPPGEHETGRTRQDSVSLIACPRFVSHDASDPKPKRDGKDGDAHQVETVRESSGVDAKSVFCHGRELVKRVAESVEEEPPLVVRESADGDGFVAVVAVKLRLGLGVGGLRGR
jgi:hypothetical protein